jgi:hypothetical protein
MDASADLNPQKVLEQFRAALAAAGTEDPAAPDSVQPTPAASPQTELAQAQTSTGWGLTWRTGLLLTLAVLLLGGALGWLLRGYELTRRSPPTVSQRQPVRLRRADRTPDPARTQCPAKVLPAGAQLRAQPVAQRMAPPLQPSAEEEESLRYVDDEGDEDDLFVPF